MLFCLFRSSCEAFEGVFYAGYFYKYHTKMKESFLSMTSGKTISAPIKRIMVYTHNSIGLGHAFRTLSLITGMQKWRPDIDFLVLSGSSILPIFLNQGIEVVKLPSIKLDIDLPGTPMNPRYLRNLPLESICDFRGRLIQDTFDFFSPDVLMVEHNMAGLMNELLPLLMKKWVRRGTDSTFSLTYVSRGILEYHKRVTNPMENVRHGAVSIDIGALYDSIYVLEDKQVVEAQNGAFSDHHELKKKIRYLGKITNKTYEELLDREQTLKRFCLPDKKIVLLNLGRSRKTCTLAKRFLQILGAMDVNKQYLRVMVIDPYLDAQSVEELRQDPLATHVHFLPFIMDLVHLVRHSHLVISRAGYNIVNEILLTGAKAILIPEPHGSGEQEYRVQTIKREDIFIVMEDAIFQEDMENLIGKALDSPSSPAPFKFDKYATGKFIIEDLENQRRGAENPQ